MATIRRLQYAEKLGGAQSRGTRSYSRNHPLHQARRNSNVYDQLADTGHIDNLDDARVLHSLPVRTLSWLQCYHLALE